jgi:hydroxypyruvate isomerase
MKFLQSLRCVLLATAALANANSSFGEDRNAFFAMDTALNDGKARSATDQAAMLKELGYDGFGASGYPTEDLFSAFEKERLTIFNTYLTLTFDSAKPGLDPTLKGFVPRLKSHDTALWIAIKGVTRDGKKLSPSDVAGDDVAVSLLRELADLALTNHVKIALYPHARLWLERVEDALRLAGKADRPNIGVTFNLCHWLVVEGNRDPKPVLIKAMPRLFFVSINGADNPEPGKVDWSKMIQPLDIGTYDVAGFVNSLRGLGYKGPIGFQGYGIRGDSREILRRSMTAWRRINAHEISPAQAK